jgi:hypothetical protein
MNIDYTELALHPVRIYSSGDKNDSTKNIRWFSVRMRVAQPDNSLWDALSNTWRSVVTKY